MSNYRSTFHEEQVPCPQCRKPILVSAMQQHIDEKHVMPERAQRRGERSGNGRRRRVVSIGGRVPWRARNEFGM